MIRHLAVAAAVTAGTIATPTHVDAWYTYQRCPQYETTLRTYAPRIGWDVRRMSYLMWRESRCQPKVVNRTGGDSGLLQVHPVTWPWLSYKLDVHVTRTWLQNPVNNVRAAAALATFANRAWGDRYQPWAVR